MLQTLVTKEWGLRYPIIGAPMANISRGRMARAITDAGGLGMIGIGPRDSVEFIQRESAVARGDGESRKFGLGLMGWVLDSCPELLDAALAERPFLVCISFGSLKPYVEKVRRAGVLLATQVNTRKDAIEAEKAGVDI